jgi:putative hydrolase of the HAD superfamily
MSDRIRHDKGRHAAPERSMIKTIGLDGDDTLWHNETIFSMTQEKFRRLLLPYVPGAEIDERLLRTEVRNLRLFGYGIKGFTLSMIETAIELSHGRVAAGAIQEIIELGKAMLDHPVEPLEGVRDVVESLGDDYELVLITKGDLFDQESKLARSGLAECFAAVEVVSEKDEACYRRILGRRGVAPGQFVMVGNSVRSDILPVLAIGGQAVHIPYAVTWAHEAAEPPERAPGYWRLGSMAELPGLLPRLRPSPG